VGQVFVLESKGNWSNRRNYIAKVRDVVKENCIRDFGINVGKGQPSRGPNQWGKFQE
jgi:hypothetical protein